MVIGIGCTPFCGSQQECATCYNGSGKVSSHHRVCPSNHLRASLSSSSSVGLLKGNHPCRFPRPASDPLCLCASCCSCTARLHLAGHPSSIYLISSKKMRLILRSF